MAAGELVSRHPDVEHGRRAVLPGTRYPAYVILRYLCVGEPVRKIQEDYRTAQGLELTLGQIANAVRYAALLARDSELTPTGAAAFMRSESASREELANVREQAAGALEEIAERMPGGELVQAGEPERPRRLALAYGAALLYFQELPAMVPEPAEGTFFRDALIAEDRDRLEECFRFRGAYWLSRTPEDQIGKWRHQIEVVEAGEAEMHEYTNDLNHRDVLEDAITLLSPASAGAVEKMIRPLDRRFEAATEHSLALIRRDLPREPSRWWHYRIPKRRNSDAEKWIKWREERSIASPAVGSGSVIARHG